MAETAPRAGRWAYRLARQRQWAILRRGWWVFAGFVVLLGGLGLATGLIWDTAEAWFIAGVVVTMGVVLPIAALVMMSGTAPTLMGGIAEGWTSDDLRAGVAGAGLVFDHVPIDYGDIDHLVLTPSTAIAVETKWRSDGWDLDTPKEQRMQAAIAQAARCGEVARKLLQRNAKVDLPVSSVLVLWGVITSETRSATYGGVTILAGSELPAYLSGTQTRSEEVTAEVLAQAGAVVRAFIDGRDSFEDRKQGDVPAYVVHGVVKPLRAASLGVLGAFIGSIACPLAAVAAVHAGTSGLVAVLAGLAATLIGWLATRWTRWRAFGWGWLGGGAAFLLFVLVRVLIT